MNLETAENAVEEKMLRYVHWLDGEFIKVTDRIRGPDFVSSSRSLDRMLKLHALFGNELVVSDVQIMDSRYVLELFLDPEFREFMKEFPGFLHLIARAENGSKSKRFSIATSGFRRSLKQDWISSAFGDSRAIIDLGRAILTAGALDPVAQLAEDKPETIGHIVRFQYGQYRKLLEGAVWAVSHFASESSNAPIDEPPRPDQSFFKILVSIAREKELEREHKELIDKTLNYVKTNIENEDDRNRRSVVLKKLEKDGYPREHQDIWHTVIHAWNCALQETMKVPGGSLGTLPYSAPVGLYLGKPTDALFPTVVERDRIIDAPLAGNTVSFLSWDPAVVGWKKIQEAFEKTSQTRVSFQAAINKDGDPRDLLSAVEDHVDALTKCFDQPILPEIPRDMWLFAFGLALVIGRPEHYEYARAGYEGLDRLLRRVDSTFRIANTLRGAAYEMRVIQRDRSPRNK